MDNLSKQFFALVALDRFISTNGKQGGNASAIEKAVESQLNDILDSFDKGLSVDIADG